MARSINPLSLSDRTRLTTSIQYSRQRLSAARESKLDTVKQFVGAHYSTDGAKDKVPVNFLELAVQIYKRHLSASIPTVIVTTPYGALRGVAEVFQLALTHLMKEIAFGETMDAVVMDALFNVGMVKCGVTGADDVEIGGFLHETGQPFADPVDLDDWVHDMTVKRWEQIGYCGDRYRMDFEGLMDSKDYDTSGSPIAATGARPMNEDGTDRVESMGQGPQASENEYRKTVEAWDIWVPDSELIFTMIADEDGQPNPARNPLRIVEWEGPEIGPYHRLAYGRVPSNTMPLPPTAIIKDLHDLANRLFRKVGRQAERQKTIAGTRGGADEDGNRILDANDGTMIRLDDPNSTKEYKFGGAEPTTLALLAQLREWIVWFGGNLDALGGLSAQAETLGQEQILRSGATQRILDMHDRTVEFSNGIVESLGDYLWYDPLVDMPLVRHLQGTKVDIPVRFNDDIREGDLIDFNLSVQEFSMQNRSPAERLQTIGQVLERWIIPLGPQMEAQGLVPDFTRMMEIVARYSGTPELEEILTFSDKPMLNPSGGDRGRQSPVTTRNTVRRNVSGMTRSGQDNVMGRLLQGVGVQDSEANAATG